MDDRSIEKKLDWLELQQFLFFGGVFAYLSVLIEGPVVKSAGALVATLLLVVFYIRLLDLNDRFSSWRSDKSTEVDN